MYVKIPKTHLHTHHYQLSSISFAQHINICLQTAYIIIQIEFTANQNYTAIYKTKFIYIYIYNPIYRSVLFHRQLEWIITRSCSHARSLFPLSRSCYRYRSFIVSVRTSIGCITIVRGTIGQLWWRIHAWSTVKGKQYRNMLIDKFYYRFYTYRVC